MPSEKLSQQTAVTVTPSRYDRLALIQPVLDGQGQQTGVWQNRTVPFSLIAVPTLLVELHSDTDEYPGEAPNNWVGSTIMASDECLWNEISKEFQFTAPGLFEVTLVGDVSTRDFYGNVGGPWPRGTSELRVWVARGATEVIPRVPNNNDVHRIQGRASDENANSDSTGFCEKFYFNVVNPEAEYASQFVPGTNVIGPSQYDPENPNSGQKYRSLMAVSVKRIGPPVQGLAGL